MIKKEADKILEYEERTVEIQGMCNVKTKFIRLIIQATRTISKSFRKYLSNTPGKHEIKELQKTSVFGTAHILREVPILKYETLKRCNNITCRKNCNYSTAATLYILETLSVAGI